MSSLNLLSANASAVWSTDDVQQQLPHAGTSSQTLKRTHFRLYVSQFNFAHNETCISLRRDAPISRLQREIAQRLHNNSILPEHVVVFLEQAHCSLQPTLTDPSIPSPTFDSIIANPEWTLDQCFQESQIVASPLRAAKKIKSGSMMMLTTTSSKIRSKSTSLFLSESTTKLSMSSNMALNNPKVDESGIEVLYDVWPYSQVVDLSKYVQKFYPRATRGYTVDRSCSILMMDKS
ncbi:hypothetical protein BDR26DRAFT_861037 [Obelidium mucronatum]|nr:hypothetical protein BDR26DRAFT_861037 [Obelidium mucronatum]